MKLLVTQSFGRESEYRRAILAVLSFWAWYTGPAEEVQTVVFTDQPDYFRKYITGVDVRYVLLTPDKMKAMRGYIDFLHRMKIALIEEAFDLYPGADMLYVDSDTFFTTDALPWIKQFKPGRSFMHLLEYKFETCRDMPLPAGETFRAYLNLIENTGFTTSNGTERFAADTESWNAGVMGLPAQVRTWLPDVYALTEQSYPQTQNHASEQYAFSLILQTRTELLPCDEYVYHYWYRVKKQITDLVLDQELGNAFVQLSWPEKLAAVKRLTNQLPRTYETHELMLRDNAIQAFTSDQFGAGYKHAFQALKKSPFNPQFIKDVLYHTKRHLTR
ncbi:hypothetical protein [Hymenobacter sp. 102]|uniref:hypothetical protein n=1 Tax=Hymenobacter sp. 102 TaxID=3403152 RepID=UPI003CF39526